jgi:hypothetical protein
MNYRTNASFVEAAKFIKVITIKGLQKRAVVRKDGLTG